MSRSRYLAQALALAVLAAGFGCANPADDKPAAVVKEAEGAKPPQASTGERYVIGEGSKIGFVGSKVTGQHDGGFQSFTGEVSLVDGRPELSRIEIIINTASLWADNERLTNHLKSADFFDVETHPRAIFRSTAIVPEGVGYRVTGDLDLHGVTKSISFPARISVEPDRVSSQAEFSIKRFDFGIAYPGKADDLIRDEVVVRLDLVAVPDEDEPEPAS